MNRKAWNKAFSLLLAIAMVVSVCTGFVKSERTAEAAAAGVSYTTHVQKKGWMSYSSNGVTSGTSGQGLRLEALKVKLTNANYSGSIEYRAYCQTYAWTNWTKNDGLAGTSGEGKRMEAVQIKLTGQMANHYDVYYRVHSQTYGWLGWAKNGETAGTSDYAKRLEAIQIKLVAKNAAAPGTTANHYVHPMVKYRTHVQSYGWQGYVMDGAMSGTSGQAKRLEAINIALTNQEYSGNITYRTHVQTYGWQSWKSNGALSGTSGQAKRLEAIEIKLTGEMANKYDVYYRVHAQKFGWLGWAKNGASAGTSGYGYRLEGIEIKLVNKGAAAPGTTANPYYAKQTTPAKPTTPTKPATVAVTGITLNQTAANLRVGGTTTLKATVAPSNATNKAVTWTSSNTSVATVSSAGVVTGKKAGTATITAKTSNGKTATCKVTVKAAAVEETGTDTNQGDEEALYNALFDINNKVTVKLNMSDDELKKMKADGTNSDTYRKCTAHITVNGKEYVMYEVGVRLKGNTSRLDIYNGSNLDDRNMVHFKLSFKQTFDDETEYGADAKVWPDDETRKARKNRTFAKLESLELKWNRNLDQTYVGNLYVNQMYRDLGVEAQNTSLANVHFAGYNYGVYTMYEPVDENFLKRYYGKANAKGDLYKCQWGLKNNGTGWDWSGATYRNDTITSMGPETDGKTFIYELKTNKKKSDQSSLKNFITTMNNSSSKATFDSQVDADRFVKYAAIAWFVGNPDDMRNNYNNHYIYFNNTTGKAVIIPYDNDRVLGMTTSEKDMATFSPFAEDTALQGGQSNVIYRNSVISRNSNYYTEYRAALREVYESKWMDYNNYLTWYKAAKKNYENVAIPDSNVKLRVKDENTTYDRNLLAFGEGNGKVGTQGGYKTVKNYFTAIKARYNTAMAK